MAAVKFEMDSQDRLHEHVEQNKFCLLLKISLILATGADNLYLERQKQIWESIFLCHQKHSILQKNMNQVFLLQIVKVLMNLPYLFLASFITESLYRFSSFKQNLYFIYALSYVVIIIFIKMPFKSEIIKGASVDLNEKSVGSYGMLWLCSQNTKNIKELRLERNQITSEGMSYFPTAKWSNLVVLNLYGNKIGDQGCKYLSTSSLTNIRDLILGNNEIGNAGVLHLSKCAWKELQAIYLRNGKIGIDGVKCLMKANWSKLKVLSISVNILTVEEIMYLLLSEQKQMNSLYLHDNLTYRGENKKIIEFLKRKLGKIEINLW